MTRIQIRFQLDRPLDEALMAHIRDAQAIYGIERIQLSKTLDSLTVEYDATRFTPADVESTLKRCGLPIAPFLLTPSQSASAQTPPPTP